MESQTIIKRPSWWRRRTKMERRLAVTTALCAIIGLIFLIILCLLPDRNRDDSRIPKDLSYDNKVSKICSSPGCIHTASRVLNYLDDTISPCEDFYQFACGKFLKDTYIPDDKVAVDASSVISDKIEEKLRQIIEKPFPPDEPRPFKMVKQLFTACMNKTLIEDQGLEDVKVTFKYLGGWPVLDGDKWREDNFDWKEAIYKFRKVGYSKNYIIDLSVEVDVKNPTKRIVSLDQPDLGLNREYLIKGLEDKNVKAYYDYMVDVAVIFGAGREAALNELKESLQFEIQLANQSLPKEKRRNATALYNAMSVEELQQNYSSIPWLEYINTILAPHSRLNDTEMVIVKVPSFISGLEDVISKTPKRVQANHLMWQAAKYSAIFLNEELRNRRLLYNLVRFGQREQMPRFRECVKVVSSGLPIAVSALYVREYFAEEAKQTAKEMVEDIRKQFEDTLRTVEWMDEKTRANALDKAKSMASHVGYPDELLNDEKLITFYSNLELDENMYLASFRNINIFSVDFASKRLRQPVNKTDWLTHSRSSVVNAFYSLVENSIHYDSDDDFVPNAFDIYKKRRKNAPISKAIVIDCDSEDKKRGKIEAPAAKKGKGKRKAPISKATVIELPAAILQDVFFDADRPKYMNYGGIGYVIGHEITHGFDDRGRQYDKEGNLFDWWQQDTKKAFDRKAQYIIDLYGNYTVTEVNLTLNGIVTQGENIADIGGLKVSYLAYDKWAKRNGEEPYLPGVKYNGRQMFWISAASIWCSKIRDESLRQIVLTKVHPPNKYRVIIPFSNLVQFAQDFRCAEGSKMNSAKKYNVW